MANKTYLVEITPIGSYYFGGENTFNTSDKANKEAPTTNYLVRSRIYPQQTALLGLMRYVILLKNEALNKPNSIKMDLIGEKSFRGDEDNAPLSWGTIE